MDKYEWLLAVLKTQKYKRLWKSGLWLAAVVLTFLTTYFLILPAITIEGQRVTDVGVVVGETDQSEDSLPEVSQAMEASSPSESLSPNSQVQPEASAIDETKESYLEDTLIAEGESYKVTVVVGVDAQLPQGTTLEVKELTKETNVYEHYRDKVLEKIERRAEEVANVLLYDIKLFLGEQEVQPKAPVIVQVSYDQPLEVPSTDLDIVHFKETGELELLRTTTTDTTLSSDSDIAFQTNSFSVYAIVQNGVPVPRATYHFENGDGTPYLFKTASGADTSQQILKNNESLKEVGLPIIQEYENFLGWFYYDKATNTFGDQVVFDAAVPVTISKDVYIRPKYGSVAYITLFANAAGTVVFQREQVPLENGQSTYDLTAMTAPDPSATQLFVGWSKTSGGTVINSKEAANYRVGEGDNLLYPVFREAKKVEFITGDLNQGTTYIPPKYVLSGSSATALQPANPTRPGYTFAGWYTSETGDTAFNFNDEIRTDTKVYARWTPAQSTYTVVYWRQSATDDKFASDAQKNYEYAGQSAPKTATVGTTVTLQNSDYSLPTGFELNTGKTQTRTEINADGSSILNVYFDRKLITMNFYYGNPPGGDSTVWNQTTDGSNFKVLQGLYGTSLGANGYTWPSTKDLEFSGTSTAEEDKVWYYYSSATGTRLMSFLGDFILPAAAYPSNSEIRFFRSGKKALNYYFYKQNLDGSYTQVTDTGPGLVSSFSFSEKYTGFAVDEYRRQHVDSNSWYEEWQKTTTGRSVPSYYANPLTRANVPLNLHVRYRRLSYQLNYLDPFNDTPLTGFEPKTVKYEETLTDYRPETGTLQPTPFLPGYRWNGKWYKDKAQTEEFDWATVMPAQDVKVYAGWEKITHQVTIDPAGGEVPRTYLTVDYGEKIPDYYSDATRDYILNPSGAYYYRYDTVDGDQPTGSVPKTTYTTVPSESNTDLSNRYSYEKGAYQLLGWYQIHPDGSKSLYNFNSSVTSDITLRAEWRRVGEFQVIYSNKAYTADGKLLKATDGSQVLTSNEPVDSRRYDELSKFALMSRSTAPVGYSFQGWYYDGKLYRPSDTAVLLSRLADNNKTITIHPVLIPVDQLPTKDTVLTYYGNGGYRIEDGQAVTAVEFRPLEINKTYLTEPSDFFSRPGYELIGWNIDENQATAGTVQFTPKQEIGLDNDLATLNTLYAVWKPKTYTVSITKIVKGNEPDKVRAFTFDPSDSLQTANFDLTHEQTKTFTVAYGTSISLQELSSEDFVTTTSVSHKNRPTGQEDERREQSGANVTLTVDGNIDIIVNNTRKHQQIALQKVSVENINQPLEGASFTIYGEKAPGQKTDQALYQDVISGADGFLRFGDASKVTLPVGTYYISEIKAPDSYNLADADLTLSVTETGVSLLQDGNAATMQTSQEGSQVLYRLKITNSRGTELPNTGGIGHHAFRLFGLFLLVPAALALYQKRTLSRRRIS